MNPAEQHNTATLKQSTEANQLTQLTETSPVLLDLRRFKVDYLSLAPHSYNFPRYSVCSPVIL
jgi:hypothetical protein